MSCVNYSIVDKKFHDERDVTEVSLTNRQQELDTLHRGANPSAQASDMLALWAICFWRKDLLADLVSCRTSWNSGNFFVYIHVTHVISEIIASKRRKAGHHNTSNRRQFTSSVVLALTNQLVACETRMCVEDWLIPGKDRKLISSEYFNRSNESKRFSPIRSKSRLN